MSITALISTLNIIGICYSDYIRTEETGDGYRAVYEYIVEEEKYTYSVPATSHEIITSQIETVFYFREYPSVRTGSLEIFIYPALTAVFGLGFALLFKNGTDLLDENSTTFGEYILPTGITILSLIPVCKNVYEVCGLYTSVLSAFKNAEESVYSASTTLGIMNLMLLLWGVWAKLIEYKKKKSGNKN